MTLDTKPYKGTRDFYPEDKRLQKYIFSSWRKIAERFGYEEYDAPIIEPIDLYISKTSEEIVAEQTYSFEDRGGRKVTLRPEMTPTVSRMVAGRRQELPYPLRWYSIPNVWRYERPQRGRLREHWQFNVDIFGIDNLNAEHELILLADSIMKDFGAKAKMYTTRLNSRKFMDFVLKDHLGLNDTQASTIIRLIDKKDKMEDEKFLGALDASLSSSQQTVGLSEKLLKILDAKTIDQLPEDLVKHDSIAELRELMSMLKDSGVKNAEFDPALMRGFDYYTDIVFEVFDNHPDNNRSMFGGGRYDGLVGQFGVDPVPTVGFGMGDVPLQNFLESHELVPDLKSETDIQVLLIDDVYKEAQKVITELRSNGLNVSVDSTGRKLDKQLRGSIKRNIRYIMFIGAKDLEEGRFNLKDAVTGEEKKHGIERLVSIIKDVRREGVFEEDPDIDLLKD